MPIYVDTLIIGATAAGCGYALTHENTLIIEKGINPAPEFALTLDRPYMSRPETEEGEWFWSESEKRGMRRGNVLHLPSLSGLLAHMLITRERRVFLEARYISSVMTDKGLETEIFTRDGFTKVISNRVISTYRDPEQNIDRAQKAICAAIVGEGFPPDGNKIVFIRGMLTGEITAKIELEADDSMSRAREKLHSEWVKYYKEYNSFSLAAEAGEMALSYIAPVVDRQNGILISASFPDIMKAFEGGCGFDKC